MSNKIKITLPPMVEGQTGWQLWRSYEVPIGRDPWPWHHRIAWRIIMWTHNQAESFWHWCFDSSRRFEEPRMRYETRYREIPVNDPECEIGQ